MNGGFTRRHMLAAGLGAGAVGLTAQAGAQPMARDEAAVLLRNAYVMTMGPEGDLPVANVLIRNGMIEAVGAEVDAPGAAEIDAAGQILLPGYVDTHTHIWLSQMRGLFSRSPDTKYFPLVERLGAAYQPEDMATGTLFGAAGNLDAGITTTFPYCDNIRRPEDAEAALSALAEAGIRARFLYTGHDALAAEDPVDLDHFARLSDQWADWSNDGVIGLGLGWRAFGPDASDAVRQRAMGELDTVRQMGLPISSHVSGGAGPATLQALIDAGVLGSDMLLVHATGATPRQLGRVEEAGAAVVLTPVTEQRVGFGVTRLADYLPHLSRVSLGIDGGLAGAPDMAAQMKMLHNIEAGASGDELAYTPRRLLELATIDGARAVGLGDTIGSIEPGKRADLQLVDPRAPNMGPMNDDPTALLVYAAGPRNTRLVMVDGHILKRNGRLTRLDMGALHARASRSIARIRKAAL